MLLGVAAALTPLPLLHRLGAFALPLLLIWVVGRETMKEAEREREALALRADTNVVRHAGARRCTMTLARVDGEVQLRVADDGSGAGAPEGNGLSGMRERVAAIGGRVERSAGAGTTLTVAVPAEVAG